MNNTLPDPLRREFAVCTRIMVQEKTSGAEFIPGNRISRVFCCNDYPVCTVRKCGFLLLDFGMELSGGVRLVTSGIMPFCRIRLRFGESCSEAMGDPNQDHAIHDVELTVSPYSSTDFGNTGFRFVRIDALDHDIELHNVLAFSEYRHYPQWGTFHSSDPLLNRIYDTCIHTVKLNMQDYILDGVKRDRLVWGGDLNPEAMVILRTYGNVSVLRDTLELLRTHTAEGNFINGFSSYTLWYFLTLRNCWFHTGDIELLRANLSFLEKEAVRLAAMVGADGGEMLPDVRFLDWPSCNSPEVIHAGLQALLLIGLEAVNEMLNELGSAVSVPAVVLQRLKAYVPDPAGSKTAAALQMLAGMADQSAVLENMPFSGISTYLGYYILLAKKNQPALDLVRKYWGAMLDLGATSFWEDFNLDWVPGATRIDELPIPGRPDIHKDFGAYCYKGLRHSLCHGWAAGPAAWCSRRILGVDPLKPGFREIRFIPDLCDLEFAEGTVPTPYGVIAVKLQKGCAPEIKLPEGVVIKSSI